MSRYHKAAIDGYLDLLKEATRKDLNAEDEDGMTPTLWAAFHGHVEALQLICSRGGDPNKSDIWGNTPLHHAANNGHMHIISFLVSFGANLFALDNEFHTAMDVAAGRDRMDCVRFLDNAASQQTTKNAKKVDALKKEAQKEAKKRVKHCEEVKKKHQNKMDKMYRSTANGDAVSDSGISSSFSSTGTMRSVNEQFSKIIASNPSGSLKATLKGTFQSRFGKKDKGTLTNAGGTGNVIFLKNENGAPKKPELLDVFTEQNENEAENEGNQAHAGYDDGDDDDYDDNDDASQTKQSIFNRPGLGGLIFMKKMGAESEDITSGNNESLGFLVQSDMQEMEGDNDYEDDGDAELPWNQEELGLDDDDDEETSPLDVFLSSISLLEFSLAFTREQLDLEALMLCSDDDLKGIRIQLGPRKKILDAVTRRKNALQNPGVMKDCFL